MPILNWLNKDQAVRAAKNCSYRLLKAEPELAYGDENSDNLLIQGDNLEALKALIPFYAGKVKCIFIDPPYNIGKAFDHYDDNLEHSTWLSLMYPRIELLRELLSEDGSLWVTLDDREAHYFKIILDEIMGRNNFVSNVIWQKKFSPQNDSTWLSDSHDHLIVYAKDKPCWKINLLPRSEEMNSRYKNIDNDSRGVWTSSDLTVKTYNEKFDYVITTPSGKTFSPPNSRCWGVNKNKFKQLVADNRVWFGKNKSNMPRLKKFLSEVKDGITPMTIWTHNEVGHNQEAKKEIKIFNQNDTFDTPKPERLIQRVLHIATNEGDLVLDSFLGSGTTAAVAHKMNRRYIGIEIGDHAVTHCQPRLKQVVDGEQGGISKAVNWQGGGGFRFCRLGAEVFDAYGGLNPEIRFADLAAHVWYLETGQPMNCIADTPYLGRHNDTAFYLLYNGILGDKTPQGGNVLTSQILKSLPQVDDHGAEQVVIYGESCRLGEQRLKQAGIIFKQIPYDVAAL